MNEKISALIDGELDDASAARVFDQLRKDERLRNEWDLYCLIGDTLRQGELAAQGGAILPKVMTRLERAPEILAPPKRKKTTNPVWTVAAAVAGVALVAWLADALLMENPVEPTGVGPLARQDVAPETFVSLPGGVAPGGLQPVTHTQPSANDALFEYMMNHQSMRGALIPDAIQYSRAVSWSLQE